MVFQKRFCVGKWVNYGPKLTYQHNSGSAPKIFSEILHKSRGQEVVGT